MDNPNQKDSVESDLWGMGDRKDTLAKVKESSPFDVINSKPDALGSLGSRPLLRNERDRNLDKKFESPETKDNDNMFKLNNDALDVQDSANFARDRGDTSVFGNA